VELLKAEGVRHAFGIVGPTFLDVLDVRGVDQKFIEWVWCPAPSVPAVERAARTDRVWR